MLWIGVLPAFLVLFSIRGVPESPVWGERQRPRGKKNGRDPISIARLFWRDVLPTTLHTSIVMSAFLFMYHSITYWYVTFIGQLHKPTLPYLAALNIGAITGALFFGRISEGRLGRRGSAALATIVGILVIPIYVLTPDSGLLWRRQLRHRAGLSHRTVPDRRPRRRRRLRVSLRRRHRIVHADAGRHAAGPRPGTAARDVRVHRDPGG